MKKTRKLFALLLAVVMMMGLSVTASAATITIENPAAGETYTAYKLFDVSNEGNAYSYSTTNQELMRALSDEEAALGITFTKAASEDVWYVSGLDTEEEAAKLAAYINTKWEDTFKNILGSGIEATPVNVGSEQEPEYEMQINTGEETGYYFVDSSLGSLCALNTVTDKVNVTEKNALPTIEKKVKEDSAEPGSEWQDFATVDTIDTIYYQLTVDTGNNVANLGTGIDGNYTITDVLPDGIVYNADTVKIDDWTKDSEYTVDYVPETRTLTITLMSGKLSTLAPNTNIVITYDAKAVTTLTSNQPYTNNVTLKYKNQEISDSVTVKTYKIDGNAEGSKFTKVDGSDGITPLEGVKFVLSKTVDGQTKYAKFDNNRYLTNWVNNKEEATALVTDANGHIYAYGLDADTYVLTETYTLPGYNLLADTITVTIGEDGSVSYQYTNEIGDEDPNTNPGNDITVENNTGDLLPSTGGMGTTLIYIAGAVLVIGAGVLLVVRRRMNAER